MADQSSRCPFPLDRRGFVRGSLAAGAALTLGAPPAAAAPRQTTRPRATVPFHGPHQAGITEPAPGYAVFAVYDVLAPDRAALERLLRALTDRARLLTEGTPAPDDNGMLGPTAPADGLTVTVGVGASLFDSRYGLHRAKPVRLGPMPAFPGDEVREAESAGDLSLQLCAADQDAVLHALRSLGAAAGDLVRPRWRVDGFQNPPRPEHNPRNLMGFHDGVANPDTGSARELDHLVWVTANSAEPAWATGGSYQVLRTIRMRVEEWERLPVADQERIIGRHRDTGAPLGGTRIEDRPDYRKDPDGKVIPLTAHIRLANPQTPATEDSRILRRGYNYDRGIAPDGGQEMGLQFCCYNQDPARQFEAVQHRLAREPLAAYLQVTGGGYFFALPGVRDRDDHYGSGLLAAV
ncbi:Dyp-type peroxidase [Kitasatospora sp. NPDC049285]|uniref:Dyp-type peroxidase n=1 Tax=Kitasatospora sp. NPDC049285 TaxID=3157096 RepID=UPI003434EF8E